MFKFHRIWILGIALSFIAGCSADLSDYQESSPDFELFEYFEGDSTAWGMVQDYSGKQTRRFEVILKGTVEGNVLTLEEDFVFDDDEEDRRVWVITRQSDGQYTGTAGDIIGEATGQVVGNALRWKYDLELQLDSGPIVVTLDDWLYRQDQNHVFNLTSIKKFGVEVGTITIFFQKQKASE